MTINGCISEIDAVEKLLSECSISDIVKKGSGVSRFYDDIDGFLNIEFSNVMYSFSRNANTELEIVFKTHTKTLSFDFDFLGSLSSLHPSLNISIEGFEQNEFIFFKFNAYDGLVTNLDFLVGKDTFCKRVAELIVRLRLHERTELEKYCLGSRVKIQKKSESTERCLLSSSNIKKLNVYVSSPSDEFITELRLSISDSNELRSLYIIEDIVNFDIHTVRMLT